MACSVDELWPKICFKSHESGFGVLKECVIALRGLANKSELQQRSSTTGSKVSFNFGRLLPSNSSAPIGTWLFPNYSFTTQHVVYLTHSDSHHKHQLWILGYLTMPCVSDSSTLPFSVRSAKEVVDAYKSFISNKDYAAAGGTAMEATSLVESSIETTVEEVRLFGVSLRKKELFVESIFIFEVAPILSTRVSNPEEKLRMVQWSVRGMRNTSKLMIDRDCDMKEVVKDHVIIFMREKLRLMKNMPSKKTKYKVFMWGGRSAILSSLWGW